MRQSAQIALPGIGQQKMTLSVWKEENKIYTHNAKHMENDNPWSCWGGDSDPSEVLGEFGDSAFGFGKSERGAILDYCESHEIKPPFWW